MKNLIKFLLIGIIAISIFSCGPSAEEKAAAELARRDSINAIEDPNYQKIGRFAGSVGDCQVSCTKKTIDSVDYVIFIARNSYDGQIAMEVLKVK